MFSRKLLVSLVTTLVCLVHHAEGGYASCKAVRQANNLNPNGEYTLTHNGQNFRAYCSFEGTVGYTYISRAYYGINIDLAQLYSHRSYAKIRIRWSSGTQKEVLVQNLASYGYPSLYFGRNAYTSYQGPQNTVLQPYLYLGFLPMSQTRNYNTQGYRAAGRDFTFRNCDANPNSYITFYFNPSNRNPPIVGGANSFMTAWMDYSSSLSSSKYMSTNYFFDWEMHMGGCGGLMTSWAVGSTKAALGLPFTIHPCDGTNCQNGGQCVVSGSTGTCSCPTGFFGTKCESRNGGWSSWGSFGSCSRSCGSGSQARTRSCNNPTRLGSGATCSGASSESRSCNTHLCPVNGGWTAWGSYSSCSLSCGTGTQSRTRACTNPAPANGGAQCVGSTTSSQNCNTHNCPIDGVWANWAAWASCSVSCGGGTQGRTRTCTNPAPAYGGANCGGASSESQACNTHNCPIDGEWTDWDTWATCSVTCGGGSQDRARSCTNPAPAYGGADCAGVSSESQTCNTHNCPIDGVWTDWASWETCSVTCGGGSQDRTRSCTNPAPAYGGANCVGVTSESQACNTHNCPIDGVWTDWAAWATCSVTCGGGSQDRTRSCSNPAPAYGGANCVGVTSESQACNTHNCPIDGIWTDWATWATCSVTCGGGSQDRTRSCSNPAPAYGGANCVGVTSENQACNTHNCPIDGGWTDWATWGSCTLTCGGGSQSRDRTCTNPAPAYGGAQCGGSATSSQACNTHNCPIDGGFTDWTSWTTCSVSCGGGSQDRERTCTNPAPQYGGAACVGDTAQNQVCNTQVCIIDGAWSAWSAYGTCSLTCGGGRNSRSRTCSDPYPANGGAACSGDSTEYGDCNTQACPTAAAGTYVQLCPTNWFTCQSGSVSCIEEAFACDCSVDCDDGSDEMPSYAGCSTQCSSASGTAFSMMLIMLAAVLGMLWK